MDWLPPLVGGLGLGSLLTTVVQTWMQRTSEQRTRAFVEKRDCYLGLIDALKEANFRSDKVVIAQYGYAKARAALVGSPEVARLAQYISETSPGSPERIEAFNQLQSQMRKDLGVDRRAL